MVLTGLYLGAWLAASPDGAAESFLRAPNCVYLQQGQGVKGQDRGGLNRESWYLAS